MTTWGQAGLKDNAEWKNLPISLYGRNSVSGTYGFFKKQALLKGDFKDTVKEQPGSAAVVNGVASDKGGIGYSGIGYKTADVSAVPLAKDGEARSGRADLRERPGRHLPAGSRSVHLREQEAQRAAAAAGCRVHQVRPFEAGPGDRRRRTVSAPCRLKVARRRNLKKIQ